MSTSPDSTRATRQHRLAVAAAVVVDISALWYLAPLEFAAGEAIGLAWWGAWTITGVVEGLVALTVLLSWCVEAALVLAWVSAIVGQAHAASVHAARAGHGLDQGTLAVVVSVPTIMVGCVYLGVLGVRQMHLRREQAAAALAAEKEAERRRMADAESARRAEQEAHEAAERAHALELQRLADERTRAERDAAQESAEADHRRAVELAQVRAADDVRQTSERAVAEADERAEMSRRRAEEVAAELAQERAARAVEVAQLRAEMTAQMAQSTAQATTRREPRRRPTRAAKSQVPPEMADGLTESELTVLEYMLGRGAVQRQAIVDHTGIPLGTVKRAITQLSAKRLIVACASRGQYQSVDPDFGVDEPSEAAQ